MSYNLLSVTIMVVNPDRNFACGKLCKLKETGMQPLVRSCEPLLIYHTKDISRSILPIF